MKGYQEGEDKTAIRKTRVIKQILASKCGNKER